MSNITLTLKKPVVLGSETYQSVSLREPTAKDFRNFPLQPSTIGQVMELAKELADCPPVVVDRLAPADMSAVMSAVTDFLEVAR